MAARRTGSTLLDSLDGFPDVLHPFPHALQVRPERQDADADREALSGDHRSRQVDPFLRVDPVHQFAVDPGQLVLRGPGPAPAECGYRELRLREDLDARDLPQL